MMSPPVMSSRPAIMRSVVRLAAARGPDQHDELLVGDVQVDAAHRRRLVVVLDHLRSVTWAMQLFYPLVAPAVRPAM